MKVDRIARVNKLLHRELSEQLYRILGPTGVDMAAVTFTRVEASPDLRNAWVWVSVLGDDQQKKDVMRQLRRARGDFQQAVNRDVHMKYTPKLQFKLDSSLADGDTVLNILSELDAADTADDANDEATTDDA